MLRKVKNNSDKVQVELLNSLQETYPIYRQDVGILLYKELKQHFYDIMHPISWILLKGSEFYSMSVSFLPHLDDPAQYPLVGEELCLHLKWGGMGKGVPIWQKMNEWIFYFRKTIEAKNSVCGFFFFHKMKFIKYFWELWVKENKHN